VEPTVVVVTLAAIRVILRFNHMKMEQDGDAEENCQQRRMHRHPFLLSSATSKRDLAMEEVSFAKLKVWACFGKTETLA